MKITYKLLSELPMVLKEKILRYSNGKYTEQDYEFIGVQSDLENMTIYCNRITPTQMNNFSNSSDLGIVKDLDCYVGKHDCIIKNRYGKDDMFIEYQPYDTVEEFLEGMRLHGPLVKINYGGVISYKGITEITECNNVRLSTTTALLRYMSFQDFIDSQCTFTWQDGSVIGKKINNV